MLNKEGRRIKDRLEEVKNREIVNHWEMDTVEGIKGKVGQDSIMQIHIHHGNEERMKI